MSSVQQQLDDIKTAARMASHVHWGGASNMRHASSRVRKECIVACRKLWDEGKLPIQLPTWPPRYVVGFDVQVSFYRKTVTLLSVAPKKPSKFKERYVRAKVID